MNAFVKIMNSMTDMDWGWWPFLFLRPKKDEFMTSRIVAKMSLYYGTFYGIFLGLYIYKTTNSLPLSALSIPKFIVLFFLVYRLTYAIFWNIRVKELAKTKKPDHLG